MTELRKLIEQSVTKHQRLHKRLCAIEKRMPLLDLESTVQATSDLEQLFQNLQHTDQQLLANLSPMDAKQYVDLLKQRLELGQTLVDQYAKITPKLQTRLAGYKAELLQIRQGIKTMGGYATPATRPGGLINTAN